MAVGIIRGPAGAGKSQWYEENAEPGDLFLDVTAIWAALRSLERDSTGRYPVRLGNDPALQVALYLRAVAVRYAAENGIDAWATTSNSSAEAVERLRERGATGRVITIDPGREVAAARLADPDTGEVSGECDRALRRWYGRRS